MFTQEDYNKLHNIVFSDDYPGYKPDVVEAPNGDGNLDDGKRYAHVAVKYLDQYEDEDNRKVLYNYLLSAHELAIKVASEMGLLMKYWPDHQYSALRVLEYPPGSGSHIHTDFDLFTLMMYRNRPDCFEYVGFEPAEEIRELNHQIHYGELPEEIEEGRASGHRVLPSDETQYSIVYFAIPDWRTKLLNKMTVGEWLNERLERSRY